MDDTSQAAASLSASLNSLSAQVANSKSRKQSERYNQWYYENIYKPSAQWQLENITKPYYGFQQDKQIEMIGRSLKANMDALRANGINPLMLNGGMELPASVGGSEDSLYQAPANADIGSVMSGLGSLNSSNAAQGLMFSQMAKNFADTRKTTAETDAQVTFNEFARQLYAGNAKTAEGNAILIGADVDWKRADIQRVMASANEADAHVKQYITQIDEMREHIRLMQSQGKLNEQTLDKITSEIALNAADKLYKEMGVKLQQKQIEELDAQIKFMLRQGATFAPAEYIQELLLNGDKTVQRGIVAPFRYNFYQSMQGQWNYAVTTGNVGMIGKLSSGQMSSQFGRSVGTLKGILDIFGASGFDILDRSLRYTIGRPNQRKTFDAATTAAALSEVLGSE